MNTARIVFTATLPVGVFLAAASASAQSAATTYVDLDAAAGYATNPNLDFDDETASVFARGAIRASHAWSTERNVTTLFALLENTAYLNHHGNQPIFEVAARRDTRVSEETSVFGRLRFSGDISGRLGSRYVTAPIEAIIPDPAVLVPMADFDPDLVTFRGRQYRLGGEAGLNTQLSSRDNLSLSLGAEKTFFVDNPDALDYVSYRASGSFERQLSERLTAGAKMGIERTDADAGGQSTSFNPQLTVKLGVSERWDASAAVGLYHVRSSLNGPSESHTGLSFDATFCRLFPKGSVCAHADRLSQTTILQNELVSTSASLSFTRRLDDKQTVQATALYSNNSELLRTAGQSDVDYFSVNGSYQRILNERLSLGSNAAVRKLQRGGIDPKADFNVSVFLRYRIGDLN